MHGDGFASESPRFGWFRLARKELREILRDRRTILTLLAMPLLVYPLLGVTFQKLLAGLATPAKIEYRVALEHERDHALISEIFLRGHTLVSARDGRKINSPGQQAGTLDDPGIRFLLPQVEGANDDVARLVRQGIADIGLRVAEIERGKTPRIELIYRSESLADREAHRFFEERLRIVNETFVMNSLDRNHPARTLPLIVVLLEMKAQAGDAAMPFSLSTLVPLILILMTVTGAVYPAIDLTAGERERGTLETLIATPIPRHQLLCAKYVAVLAVALLTALANLVSMTMTAYASGLDGILFGSGGLTPRLIVTLLGLLVLFAGFFSAVLLVLTSVARSFKEAQAYLIPLMLISIAPGVLCLLPGIELSGWLAVTPLVNIVLLARDSFEGGAAPVWVVATLLSTLLYGMSALALAAHIFGTDSVLSGSDGSWGDLVRRPSHAMAVPSLRLAAGYLALLFPAFVLLGSLPARWPRLSVSTRLGANSIVTVLLFAVGPLVVALWSRIDLRAGLRLVGCSWRAGLAAALFGLSLWTFAYEAATLVSPQAERLAALDESLRTLVAELNRVSLPWKLLTLAMVPAVCEELFFRGFLLSALRAHLRPGRAVAASALVFGLFHVIAVAHDALFLERLLPTTLLGLVLGWVCVRSGSLWPGIVLHALHNGLLIAISSHTQELLALGVGVDSQTHLPGTWLAGAAAMSLTAVALIELGQTRASRLTIGDQPGFGTTSRLESIE